MRDNVAALQQYIQQRAGNASYGHPRFWVNHQLPAMNQVTQQDIDNLTSYLLEDADFRAIQLGTWLGTPEGKEVRVAINKSLPPVYRPYAELFELAVMRAATLQHEGKVKESGRYVIGAAVVIGAGMLAWLLGNGS